MTVEKTTAPFRVYWVLFTLPSGSSMCQCYYTTALRVLIGSYLVHNYTCGFAGRNFIWLFCLSLSLKKDKYEVTCLRLFEHRLRSDTMEDLFSETLRCGFHSLTEDFSITRSLWWVCNPPRCKWFALSWTHAASVFSEVYCWGPAVLPGPIKSAQIHTDMDSKGLWTSAGPACLGFGPCHAWLPTWCLQEFWNENHNATIWYGLTHT